VDEVTLDSDGITSHGSTTVYCPLVRDTDTALESVGVGFHNGYLNEFGYGGTGTARITCTLYAKAADGSASDSITVTFGIPGDISHPASGTGWFNSELDDLTEGTNRVYTIKCGLEAGETLGGVEWDE
jgi:hypothetical protein